MFSEIIKNFLKFSPLSFFYVKGLKLTRNNLYMIIKFCIVKFQQYIKNEHFMTKQFFFNYVC